MRRTLIFIVLSVFALNLFSQTTSSPYSYFGLGHEENPGTAINHALGGTGIGSKSSNYLNTLNPASYTGIDSLSFIFDFGINSKFTRYKNLSTSANQLDANLDFLAIGFKAKPWWATSLGVSQHTTVGYNIEGTGIIEGELSTFSKIYTGKGGVSQFNIGNSFQLGKQISLGVNASYLFGSIDHTETIGGDNELQKYVLNQNYRMHNIVFDYGLLYSLIKEKYSFTLGLIYGPSKSLVTNKTIDLTYNSDTLEIDNNSKEKFYYPDKKGIGFSFEKDEKLRFAFDYITRGWSKTYYADPLVRSCDSQRFSSGIEFKPSSKYAISSGLSKWTYRLGAYYETSNMIIKQHQLISRSLSLGVGIPMKRELSNINVSFELGDYGTLSDNLIKENYLLIHLNISLQDKWFQKRKVD